jgi:hypothetical protein
MSEIKQYIRDKILIYEEQKQDNGGQKVAMVVPPATILESEELGLKMTISTHRSKKKNRELAMKIFEIVLDEQYK